MDEVTIEAAETKKEKRKKSKDNVFVAFFLIFCALVLFSISLNPKERQYSVGLKKHYENSLQKGL